MGISRKMYLIKVTEESTDFIKNVKCHGRVIESSPIHTIKNLLLYRKKFLQFQKTFAIISLGG